MAGDRSEVNEPDRAAANTSPTSGAKANIKKDPREIIRSAFAVLKAQKKIDQETFKEKYLFGVASKDLTDEQSTQALAKIKSDFKELKI
jgi:hypothetical protein